MIAFITFFRRILVCIRRIILFQVIELFCNNFPFIQAYPWDDRQPEIYGNILEVTDDQLEKLDQYENIKSGLYVRQKVAVYEMKSPAEPEVMWAYIGGPALVNTPIPSGDWEIQ